MEVKPAPRAGHVHVPGHYEYLPEQEGCRCEFSTIEKKGDKSVYRSGEWVPR